MSPGHARAIASYESYFALAIEGIVSPIQGKKKGTPLVSKPIIDATS
jgi:hypothetical protein